MNTKDDDQLRDYFAANAPASLIEVLGGKLSSGLLETLVGRAAPLPPEYGTRDERLDYQLDAFDFRCEVNAALRYRYADAMLVVSRKYRGE